LNIYFFFDKHQAAAREKNPTNRESLVITPIEDDDIDYEQLFDDHEIIIDSSKQEIKKPVKRVRFDPIIHENSLTPMLPRPPSVRPRFDIEFDFDSLASPSIELNKDSSMDTINWKDAFLSDLHIAKKNKPTIVSSPSIIQIENKTKEDTLWDFMKEANPELLEKLERTNNEKQKRIDRFSMQQPTSAGKTNGKTMKSMSVPDEEGIQKTIYNATYLYNFK
jgi:hypothetical protein